MGRTLVVAAALALALAGCSGDPRDEPITPEMLESPARLQAVSNRLEPSDRDAFSKFVANRSMVAVGLGGSFVDEHGRDPKTVGDAIRIVQSYEVRMAEVDKLAAERDQKIGALREKREALNAEAEAAGWAPEPTNRANAVIEEIEAVQADYDARIAPLLKQGG